LESFEKSKEKLIDGNIQLDGNISLKFLLETRLQSESSDTLDDLLGFGFKSYDLN